MTLTIEGATRPVPFNPLDHRSDDQGYNNPEFCEEFAAWRGRSSWSTPRGARSSW